jgi:hypothetical protein
MNLEVMWKVFMPNLRQYIRIFLEGVSKPINNMRGNSRSLDGHLNSEALEQGAGVHRLDHHVRLCLLLIETEAYLVI